MNRKLLEYLVCPLCQTELCCSDSVESHEEIETGMLTCSQCTAEVPIIRGIPRFVGIDQQSLNKTVEAFGWQWQQFSYLHDTETYKTQFLDWVAPIQPEYIKNKVVVDAGCGMGRFAHVSHEFGAKTVLAIDASEAVEAARQNLRNLPNVHVIQADIYNLPLRRGSNAQIDFMFSIGVIHHLDNPQRGFQALIQNLKPDGSIFMWLYGYENNRWLVNFVNPIRVRVTSQLPRKALYAFSGVITLGLHPLLKLLYNPVNSLHILKPLKQFLPYNDYLAWLGQFQFHHNHHVVFDHLVTPVAFYLRREEIETWLRDANMQTINMSWRNRNSWRVHATFPKEMAATAN